MNQFTFLDTAYTMNNKSCHGEIVGVSVRFLESGWNVPDRQDYFFGPGLTLNWKRKTSAVPASVNAFHMHRGLCSELRDSPWFKTLATTQQRSLTKQLALCVSFAYLENVATDSQGMSFMVNAPARQQRPNGSRFEGSLSVMEEVSMGTERTKKNLPFVLDSSVILIWKLVHDQKTGGKKYYS